MIKLITIFCLSLLTAQDTVLVLIEVSSTITVDASNPLIELYSPNGGENYDSGEILSTQWEATDDSFGETPISIFLIPTLGGFPEGLATGTSNDSYESVTLPEIDSDFARMRVEAMDEFGNTSLDMSDGYFIIGTPEGFEPDDSTLVIDVNSYIFTVDSDNPFVELITPNGGEEYDYGELMNIYWSATDDSFGETPIDLSALYELDGNPDTLIEGIENTGLVNIITPAIETEYGKINVSATDQFGNTNSDDSDDYFKIGKAQMELNLHSGANLLSFYILPELPCTPIADVLPCEITGVIGEGVAATQNSCGNWVGSLSGICEDSGYWILSQEESVIEIAGFPVSEVVYDLHEGNNLISFPSPSTALISDAIPDDVELLFTGIIGEGVASVQISDYNWVGSLTNWEGGKGYWANLSDDVSFSFELDDLMRVAGSEKFIELPDGIQYNQSTKQAFYFVESIENIEIGDWIVAYFDDVVIGARQWNGQYTDIPTMGNDGSDITQGYIEDGLSPIFKISRNDEFVLLTGDYPVWSNNEIFNVGMLTESIKYPKSFSLEKAYPNPFNPTTTINFSLPIKSEISISIYNILGREVVSLINTKMEPGYHTIKWNATAFSSGVYFLKMIANTSEMASKTSYINTQKLILVK